MHTHENIYNHDIPSDTSKSERPKDLYLNLLTEQDTMVSNGRQYIASKSWDELRVVEIKGTFDHAWTFDLAYPSCFWLCFQFMGQSNKNADATSSLATAEFQGFHCDGNALRIHIEKGKSWMVLLGLNLSDKATFQIEWPIFKGSPAVLLTSSIGYRVRRIFDKIQQYSNLPFSSDVVLRYHFFQLLDIYHKDLEDRIKVDQQSDLVLYHRAVLYISEHYMDSDIGKDKIAEELNVSVRKLYRAFEGKHTTIKTAIQKIRLYRARELLRETRTSIDGIAFQLHFSTAKYFYRQFTQLFGHSPTKERELHGRSKKKKRT